MGYLECDKCGGVYELEENESPEDFSDSCECGGKLNYSENSNPANKEDSTSNSKLNKDISFKICPHCNFNNKPQAVFCKQCGKQLEKNFINRFNDEINLLSVFIGLAISCIVLIVGSALFGSIVASASLDLSIYVGLVLVAMVFLGGTATGIVGCHEFKDGAMNGIFMSLVTLVILGFLVGFVLFIAMGITAAMSSAFPYASTSSLGTSSSTATSDGFSLEFIYSIIKGIIIIVLVFLAGAVGGSFGVFLKNGLKEVFKTK